MNRKFYSILCAAACLFAFSCTKSETPAGDDVQGPQGGGNQEEVVDPSVPEDVPEGYIRVSVSANAEVTKTSIAPGEGAERIVSWTAGDKIKVFYEGGSTETEVLTSGTSTTLVFDVPEEVESYSLCYPADADVVVDDATMSLTISAEQDGAFAKANVAFAKGTVTDESIQFYNANAMFKLVVTDATLTKAVIAANKGEAVVGTFPYTFAASGIAAGTVSESASAVTLNINGAGTYYVSVLPGANLTEGATVRFYRDENPAGAHKKASALEMPRSTISSWGELDKVACNRYVTVSGAGTKDGKSWDNAWGRDELKAFLADSSAFSSEELALMNGLTVRVAAGTYVMPNAANDHSTMNLSTKKIDDLSFNFVGGYPAAGGDEVNATSNVTTLSGNKQANVLWVKSPVNISMSGFTITDGKTNQGGHSALSYAAPGQFKVENCKFVNNVNGYTCAGLNITGGAEFSVANCTFDGNAAAHAAGFNVDGAESKGSIKSCNFQNNKSNNPTGSSPALKVSNGLIEITDCNFTNNTTQIEGETGSHGGAIWLANGDATFTACTIQGNTGRWGGAIYSNDKGKATFIDCEIKNNSIANGSGGAVAIDAGALTFTNCTATGNESSDRGGVFFVSNAGQLTVNGGNYSGNKAKMGGVFYGQGTSTMTLSGATIKNNQSTEGGGVMGINANATVNFENCDVQENNAATAGGVIIINGAGKNSPNTPTLNINGGNTFAKNYSVNGGGVLRIRQEPTVTTKDTIVGNETKANVYIKGMNTFSGNYATGGYGGCLDIRTSGKVVISGATFTGNQTKKDENYCKGGAISLSDGELGTGDIEITDCKFINNTTPASTTKSCNGGAINVGGNGADLKLLVKVNNCLFDGNRGKQGGAVYLHGASSTLYMNACAFTRNYISHRYGTTISAGGGNLFMNNCSFADDTYSTEGSNQQCTWVNFKGNKVVVSNTTMVGSTRKNSSVSAGDKACLLRYDGLTTTGHYLINNLIASTNSDCAAIWADKSPTINMVSNKISSKKLAATTVVINASGENGENFMGNSAYFGDLAWTAGTAAANSYWAWNGTLSGGSNTNKAALADVNAAIKSADANFHAWLETLGALSKDGRGTTRVSPTWPGAYQN